ncbi:ribokinase [Allomyces macrogynus ATCC 38327]|uniref:Ribokinase n=1 Tax=Allomyces macrogynus (strain ATCC 38327) TaxID=578462 RepID=A0A0L0S2N5_ALLM3|nr:ribokinase [Allomyces macrogynus ATCC 38327]|eukprot:KNE56624.1 ribokinase [Allomyces macrogynus ATCC 38327]
MASRVFVLGSVNIDDVYRVEDIVRPGQTIASTSKHLFPGGKGANQSVAAAQAHPGLIYHVGAIGTDGQWVADLMAQRNVNVEFLTVLPDISTGRAIIQLSAAGENAIVLHAGANATLSPIALATVFSRMTPTDYVLLQNEVSHGPELLLRARASGANVAFNPAPCSTTLREQFDLHAVDVLVVNEGEAVELAHGLPTATANTTTDEAVERLAAVMTAFPQIAIGIVTLGPRGAAVVTRSTSGLHVDHVASLAIKPVDTTGAGDTCVGFLVGGLARRGVRVRSAMETDVVSYVAPPMAETVRREVLDCVRAATAAAAMACEGHGAMASIPTYDAVIVRMQS